MNRLFKLKEWLTIPDAARHLSGVCGEPVTEADVLRLGLDKHLTLSAQIVNGAPAKIGKVVPLEQARTTIFPGDASKLADGAMPHLSRLPRLTAGSDMQELDAEILAGINSGALIHAITDISIDADQYLQLEDALTSVSGVWDLPMIGAETLDVEHRYQQLTAGPEVKGIHLNGTFLTRPDGEWAQLLQRIDVPEMRSMLADAKKKIVLDGVTSVLRIDRAVGRPFDQPDTWFPAGGLPEDCVLVVRTAALREFEALIDDKPAMQKTASESTRKTNTLLRIIGLMANHRYGSEIGTPFTIANHLVGKAKELGIKISDDSIAKHLKSAIEVLRSESTNPSDPN